MRVLLEELDLMSMKYWLLLHKLSSSPSNKLPVAIEACWLVMFMYPCWFSLIN